jgi:hypothetical protein
MAASREAITRLVLKTLSESERQGAVLYLDDRLLRAGDAWTVGRSSAVAPCSGYVVFVDPTPQVNWGHPCRYLLVDAEHDRVETQAATFPPFLTTFPSSLSLLWKGPRVPEWAVAVP